MKKLVFTIILVLVIGVGLVSRHMNPMLIYKGEVISTETILRLREQGLALYCVERTHDLVSLTLACFDTEVEVNIDIAQQKAETS